MMNRKKLLLLQILLLALGSSSMQVIGDGTSVSKTCSGIWASNAKQLYYGDNLIPVNVSAPDKAAYVKTIDDVVVITGKNIPESRLNIPTNPSLMEVIWSPDSRSFAINTSDGGAVGSWIVNVYTLSASGKPEALIIDSEIGRIVETLPKCDEKEDANVGIAAWLSGGNEFLLVVEVPPHSSCRNMGALRGFRVSTVSGKIKERLSEEALRQSLGSTLGCRFSEDR